MSRGLDYQLYGEFGDRYDLHTPACHYQNDHEFVLSRACTFGKHCRILDLGCGTGIFLEKALARGLNPIGFDSAEKMILQAQGRVGQERALLAEMETFAFNESFHCIVSLSWSINYCTDNTQLKNLLQRCYRSLLPHGELILQVAHAPSAKVFASDFHTDREFGPGGVDDIVFRYRFWAKNQVTMLAEYCFRCVSTNENFREIHYLQHANALFIAVLLRSVGFKKIELLEDWRGQRLVSSISPFILAQKPLA